MFLCEVSILLLFFSPLDALLLFNRNIKNGFVDIPINCMYNKPAFTCQKINFTNEKLALSKYIIVGK